MHKLTLSVDAHVVRRAKAFARANGTSVSGLVESMLDMASRKPATQTVVAVAPAHVPMLTKLRGSLNRGSVADYQRHLEQKYR